MTNMRQFAVRAMLVATACMVGACSGLNADNPAATFQAERAGYIEEATSIAQSAQAQGTQVVATVSAAETYTVLMEGRNEQLLATMQIPSAPTQALVESSEGAPGMNPTPVPPDSFVGEDMGGATPLNETNSGDDTEAMRSEQSSNVGGADFTQVATASSVRDADGCAGELTSAFPASVGAVYITTRALNVSAGTQMQVEWFYEGELAHSEGFTIPSNDDDFCMWFSLVPTDTSLSSGNWSVTLYADGQPVEPTQIPFTVG